jgi:phosphatidylinositol glycan class V
MRKYLKYLAVSRLAIYVISLTSSLLVDHGEQAVGLYEKMFAVQHPTVFKLLRPLVFYDGDFFFEIALTGYNYDKIHAFFPGFPLVVRIGQVAINFLVPDLERPLAVILSAWIINLLLSIATFYLVSRLFETIPSIDSRLRDLTLKVLVINPMSIYLSSFYSEGLFLFIQTLGLYIIARKISHGYFSAVDVLMPTLVFCLGGFVRSNGFLSGGFVLYFYVIYNFRFRLLTIMKVLIVSTAVMTLSVLPFLIVQYTGYQTLCSRSTADYDFCQRRFPSVYNFVQKKYWDVEFLSAIEGRRLANLVFILPIFALLFFYGAEKLRLGSFRDRMFNILRLQRVKDLEDFLVPSFYLFLILLLIGLTVMHYNSFTRLLAGYPLFYIFLAELYLSSGDRARKALRFWMGPFQIFVTVFAVNNYLPI